MYKKIILIVVCFCVTVKMNETDAYINSFLTSGKLNKHPMKISKLELEKALLLKAQNARFKLLLKELREARENLDWKIYMLESKNRINPLFIG